MKRQSPPIIALLLLLGPWSHWALAQSIPTAIPYTGVVTVDGIRFNGNGFFKFAIINPTGQTLWSNAAPTATGEPVDAVTIAVSNGLYGIELGDTDRTNMMEIPSTVFNTPLTFLRVWFSDGVNGFQLLSPDRQLVSVPYAYQAEKAHEVSGTGTVVKNIGLAGSTESPLTDEIVLEGTGNVQIQRPVGTNTIRIVGTDGTAAAVGLDCAQPCVDNTEISGALTDAQIPDLGTLSGVLTDVQIPATIARDSEVPGMVGPTVSDAIAAHSTATGAHTLSVLAGSVTDAQVPDLGTLSGTLTDTQIPDLNTLSGILLDAQIPSAISRDSEVTAGVSAAIGAHAIAPGAHNLSVLAGSVTDAQIPAEIARDDEVPGLVGTTVSDAIAVHSTAPGAHTLSVLAGSVTDAQVPDLGTLSGTLTDAQIPDLNALSGVLLDAQIPPGVARDSEVPGLIGTTVSDGIAAHAVADDAHALSSFTTGTLAEPRIDAAIARVSQLPTWATLAGIPADIADGDQVGIAAESDPQVGALSDTRVPRWNGALDMLVDGQISDTGAAVVIGTPSAPTTLTANGTVNVTGTMTVASLAAGYSRELVNQPAAGGIGGIISTVTVQCPPGTRALGGGVENTNASVVMLGSWPGSAPFREWSVSVNNLSADTVNVTYYAVCAAIQ